jgi:hypothetical protein
MNINDASSALYACIGFMALTALWCLGWKQWALDSFRQDLYAARDRLFDLAWENRTGSFSFEHEAYGQLRRQFNKAIRYAHRVSTFKVLVFLLGQFIIGPRINFRSMKAPWDVAVESVDSVLQPEIREVIKMWDRALAKYLALTSPLFILCIAGAVFCAIVMAIFNSMLKKLAMRFAVSQASARFSSVVWTEVAIVDAMEEERMCRLIPA